MDCPEERGMGNINGKGAKGKATRLHSEIVRSRVNYTCENCGKTRSEGQIQCAHIISRHMVATRTDEENAFALCASCHWYFGKWPIEFARFVFSRIGEDGYDRLAEKATEGKGKKVDWDAEVERLNAIKSQ